MAVAFLIMAQFFVVLRAGWLIGSVCKRDYRVYRELRDRIGGRRLERAAAGWEDEDTVTARSLRG